MPSCYLEEAFKQELTTQLTQQPISCFCFSFTSDIKAEAKGLHSPLLSYQCTMGTGLFLYMLLYWHLKHSLTQIHTSMIQNNSYPSG